MRISIDEFIVSVGTKDWLWEIELQIVQFINKSATTLILN